MTFLLLNAIKKHLEEAFQSIAFRESDTANEKYRAPRIYIGALSPKRHTEEQGEDFPYIVVRAVEGEDAEDGATATVRLLCGAYTAQDDEAGANDIQNMIDRCRWCLLQARILENRFALELPLKWKLGDDQDGGHPHPYYHGTLSSRWTLPGIEHLMPTERESEIFGSGYP